jgi:hypothetical protein
MELATLDHELTMKEIYLLSGLGADKRVFDFVDFSAFKINYVEWIEPLHNETIESYAKRLLTQIHTHKPALIGISFVGIVAIEIAKLIEADRVILISSVKTKADIPIFLRIAGRLRLHKLIPIRLLKSVNRFTFWFFGTKTESENELLRAIVKETDNKFLRWAIDKIVNWKNTSLLTNLVHIHGTDDKMLPLRTTDFKISGGGHLMVINQGEELSRLLKDLLQ